MQCIYNLFPGTSKSTNTPLSVTQTLNLNNRRCINLLQHELCNPISLGDLKVHIRVIEQQNLQWAAIVFVNDTGTRINEVLDRWRISAYIERVIVGTGIGRQLRLQKR